MVRVVPTQANLCLLALTAKCFGHVVTTKGFLLDISLLLWHVINMSTVLATKSKVWQKLKSSALMGSYTALILRSIVSATHC